MTFLDVEIRDVHITRNDICAPSESRRGNRIILLGCDIRDLHLRRIEVGSKLVFEDCNIDRIDIITTTEHEIVFRECEISELGVNGELSDVRVQDCEIETCLEIRGSVSDLHIQGTFGTTDSAHCLLSGEISSGVLAQPADGNLVYIADDATIGDVTSENADPPLQRNYWFFGTKFDGTRFNRWSTVLAKSDYRFHPDRSVIEATSIPAIEQVHEQSGTKSTLPTKIRITYQNAKQQASEVGENTAAGEFFMHEKRWRGEEYKQLIKQHHGVDRFIDGYHYLSNRTLGFLSGWGERPSRVFLSSCAMIVGFTVIYSVLFSAYNISNGGGFIGYAALSIGAFVTLILETPVTATQPIIQLITAFEGFLGAFMIALFVFTLTRSLHR